VYVTFSVVYGVKRIEVVPSVSVCRALYVISRHRHDAADVKLNRFLCFFFDLMMGSRSNNKQVAAFAASVACLFGGPCMTMGASCEDQTCCCCFCCCGHTIDQWCRDLFRTLPRNLWVGPDIPDAVLDDLLRVFREAGGGVQGIMAMQKRVQVLPAAPPIDEWLAPALQVIAVPQDMAMTRN
jgi:hypothetical protein